MDEKQEKIIGFEYLTCNMNLACSYGIKHMQKLKPYSYDRLYELNAEYGLMDYIIARFDKTEAIIRLLHKMKDISGILKSAEKDLTLDLIDLYEIKMQAIVMNEMKELLENMEAPLALRLADVTKIILLLSEQGKPLSYDFYIYDSYSKKLALARDEKRSVEQLYYKAAGETEKTKFRKLRSDCVILEEEEELRIRKLLSEKLRSLAPVLNKNIETVGHLDALIVKAKLAIKDGGIRPEITKDRLVLTKMLNPFILDKVRETGNVYTCNSIELTEGATVITGANMSGKSSVLKTVMLNSLLARLGFFVYAESAQIPLFDCMYFMTSELEKEMHGLSSFGLEITKLNEVLKDLKTQRCLVCIDEFAKSTNPQEGEKFVRALAEYADSLPSFTLIATHYDGVAAKAKSHYQIAGLKKEALGEQHATLKNIHQFMDYSLNKVSETAQVPKEAYNVSLLLGIDADFKTYLDKNYEE